MLVDDLAVKIAPVVLANITTRYPYHDSHLFRDGETIFNPHAAHPAFGNSFDWHSSVHSHWTAIQLLSHFAKRDDVPDIIARLRNAVANNLAPANLAIEVTYLVAHPTYERPYGWAWAMRLAASASLHGFGRVVADNALRWLSTMPGPVRHGVHSNTAFSLGLMLDASRSSGFDDLERVIIERALTWFSSDAGYPQSWERSSHDFLSPGLAEADLMRLALPADRFRAWWRAFLPDIGPRSQILAIAAVPDADDGQIVHLHGLNLSRAGMLARIAPNVHASSRDVLLEGAKQLYAAGLPPVFGTDYLATHWLPTFAWDAASSIDAAAAA